MNWLHAHRDGFVYSVVLLGICIVLLTTLEWAQWIDNWAVCK